MGFAPARARVGLLMAVVLTVLGACTGETDTPDGPPYFISFVGEPRLLDTPQPDPEVRVVAETNLPDETLVIVTYTDDESHGWHCCSEVEDGMVQGKVAHASCRNAVFGLEAPPSSTFRITFMVVPDTAAEQFECLNPEGCSNPQPSSVQRALGENFERLRGPQVQMRGGSPALIASKTFRWPPGSCASEE